MNSIHLSPLYSLTHSVIDTAVSRKSAGVYVLDRSSDGSFSVEYVGRSEADVSAALRLHVGAYRFFKYAYCSSPRASFEAVCELYHDYRPADSAGHPANHSGWTCPRCESRG